jgi:hypothetical protein
MVLPGSDSTLSLNPKNPDATITCIKSFITVSLNNQWWQRFITSCLFLQYTWPVFLWKWNSSLNSQFKFSLSQSVTLSKLGYALFWDWIFLYRMVQMFVEMIFVFVHRNVGMIQTIVISYPENYISILEKPVKCWFTQWTLIPFNLSLKFSDSTSLKWKIAAFGRFI